MRAHFPKLSKDEALKELRSSIAELDACWERDGLDWAPDLLKILREFTSEASMPQPDRSRLRVLQGDVHDYFKTYRFLKGIYFVREWVDMICEEQDSKLGQSAAANRRPALQPDDSGNLSAIVAADRAFPAAVAELLSFAEGEQRVLIPSRGNYD